MQPDSTGQAFRRFPTDNIKLAAIMLTMGFPLSEGMPCEIDLHAQTGKRNKRWWFGHEIEWNGATHEAWRVENWFKEKESFEAGIGKDHPITWMRAALDAREWLIRLKHGEVHIKGIAGGCKTFPTDDWLFASCLIAAKYRLLKMDSKRLYFFDDGNCAKQLAQYLVPFDAGDKLSTLPIIWRREALRARNYLHTLIDSSLVVPMVHTTYKGAQVILSSKASRETKRELFSL